MRNIGLVNKTLNFKYVWYTNPNFKDGENINGK